MSSQQGILTSTQHNHFFFLVILDSLAVSLRETGKMIYQLSILTTLVSLVLSQTTPAPVVTDNQYGAAYSVALVHGPGPLAGTFDFKAFTEGVNVAFNVNGFNVSDETTYSESSAVETATRTPVNNVAAYHIHEKPVPSDGNCNATGEHFDPYHVGASHKCVANESSMCQLGDLSGKHGAIGVNESSPTFATAYQDVFLSTNVGDIAFFANLSIVIHRKRDSYRLNCGNFSLYGYPISANASTQAASNLSTTFTGDSSISLPLAASSAVTISSNMTSTVSAVNTPAASSSAQYFPPAGSRTSSGMSLQTGNHGSRRVEVSLLVLGGAAVIPMIVL